MPFVVPQTNLGRHAMRKGRYATPLLPRRPTALRRWMEGLRREEGAAIYVAVVVLAVLFVVVGVAFQAAQLTQEGAHRDQFRKRAVQAAEAGTSLALYRLNKVATTDLLPCVVVDVNGVLQAGAAAPDGWCNEVSGTVGGATYKYKIKRTLFGNPASLIQNRIVSTGTLNGQARRVMLTAALPTGTGLFGGAGVKSLLDLTLNGNANITGSAASNEDITLVGNATICGNAIPGPNGTVTPTTAVTCGGSTTPATEPFVLPPPEPGGDDTSRFFGSLLVNKDPRSPDNDNQVSWDGKELKLDGNGTLILGGIDYQLCKLTMTGNSELTIGATVRKIHFKTLAECGYTDNTDPPTTYQQLHVSGNAKITNLAPVTSTLGFAGTGNSSGKTEIHLSGNSVLTTSLIVVAPDSSVAISGNGTYSGSIAAKSVDIDGNGEVVYAAGADSLGIDLKSIFKRQRFVECTPTPSGVEPDSGC